MDSAAGRKLIPRSDFAYAVVEAERMARVAPDQLPRDPQQRREQRGHQSGSGEAREGEAAAEMAPQDPDDFREAHRLADQDVAPARFRDQPRAQVAVGDVAHVHDPEFDVGHAQAQAAVAEFVRTTAREGSQQGWCPA